VKRKLIFELDTTKRELKMEVETEFKDKIEKEESKIIRSNMTDDELIGYIIATEVDGRARMVSELNMYAAFQSRREKAWKEKNKEIVE
jgi:hypothetical protein